MYFSAQAGYVYGGKKKKRRLFLKSSSKCDFIIQPCWSFCLEHAMCQLPNNFSENHLFPGTRGFLKLSPFWEASSSLGVLPSVDAVCVHMHACVRVCVPEQNPSRHFNGIKRFT